MIRANRVKHRPFSDFSFQQFLNEHKLMGARCTACQGLFVPPRSLCPKCHGSSMTWEQVKGKGHLAAFTVIAIGPPAMFDAGYSRDNPYCCGVVELDEKARLVARIEGVDTRNPAAISIGTPMQAVYSPQGGDADRETVLSFRPVEGAGP